MTIPTLPQQSFKPKPIHVDFKEEALRLEWNYVQAPNENSFTLDAKKGILSLQMPQLILIGLNMLESSFMKSLD